MVAQWLHRLKVKFTKKTVADLAVGEYGDTEARGLRVRVTKAGTRSFYVLRKVRGRAERFHIGRFPDWSVENARKQARQINQEVDLGENPNEMKRARRSEMSLDELFDFYRDSHLQPHTRNPATTITNYELYLREKFGGYKLSELTKLQVQRHQSELHSKRGYSAANKMLTLLKALYNRASSNGLFTGASPAIGLKKYKDVQRERLISPGELKSLFSALQDKKFDNYRDLWLLLLITGARRGNVQAMQWSEINFDSGEWRIPVTKNGKPQTVQLIGHAQEILSSRMALKGDSPYVFPSKSHAGHLKPLEAWKRLIDAAGLQNLRMHDLRHAFGSYLAATGANQFVIQEAMGHSDIQSTSRYVQLSGDVVRNSIKDAAKILLKDAGQFFDTIH